MSLIQSETAASSDRAGGDGRGAVALCIVLLLAGATLRCHDVAKLSINGDEIYSVWETRSARKAAEAVDAGTAWVNRFKLMVKPTPFELPGIEAQEAWRLRWGYRTNPLCLLMNEAAFARLGPTPLAVRLGSLLCGLAAMVVLPWLARPLLGNRGALLLLALIALCPDVVEMARDARYRSACFLFGGIAALAAARFARDRRPRDEWLCLGACVLLVLSHLTGLLVAATLFLHVALVSRGKVALRLLPVAAALALVAWYFGPHRRVGEVIQQGIVDKVRYPWWQLAASLAYNVGPALIALGVVGVAGMRKLGTQTLLPIVAAALLPALALFWINRRNDVGPRYFGAITAAGLIVSAWGAEFLFRRARTLGIAALVVTFGTQAPLLASNWIDGQRYPYAEAAARLRAMAKPEDRILSNWSGILEYYLDPRKAGELPSSVEKLVEQLEEGVAPRAFLVVERQRGKLAWPGHPERLEEWLELRAQHDATLGERRLDSVLENVPAGYHFELEIYEVDLVKLRQKG
jgi:hypothetical protein